jgi:hypothetical protein
VTYEAATTLTSTGSANIGIVIISGDFTFLASQEEFDLAFKGIYSLLGPLDVGPDHIVIVPGNHDIKWTKKNRQKYKATDVVDNAPAEATAEYRKFYERLLRHPPNDHLSMGRRFVLPNGNIVDVCALNSSSLETGKNYLAGMGKVHDQSFSEVARELGWNRSKKSLAFRLVTVHHHVTATEDVEDPGEYGKGFGMAIDAKKTLREAAKSGAHFVLHGHRHRTFFWRESVYALPEDTKPEWSLGHLGILGGGSAGSTDVPVEKNYFNLLTLDAEKVVVDVYQSKKRSAFERMCSWEATVAAERGRLVVGEWRPLGKATSGG